MQVEFSTLVFVCDLEKERREKEGETILSADPVKMQEATHSLKQNPFCFRTNLIL